MCLASSGWALPPIFQYLPIMQSYKSMKELIFCLGDSLLIQLLLEILSDTLEIYSTNLINIFNPVQLTIPVTYARTGDTRLLAC